MAFRSEKQRIEPQAGQESVWDYPRPPVLVLSPKTVSVSFAGQQIACSASCYRLLETSHPPSWYIPRDHVRLDCLVQTRKQSFCEWKGAASYWGVRVGDRTIDNAAWSYENPSRQFSAIQGYFAFYPDLLECLVDGERVQPQPGTFYGGWITKDVVGPFKGGPGSVGW